MLKCWDFLPASLTPAFNYLSSIHSTLSPKVLSTYHLHSSLFYVLIQICTVSIKYLTLQTLWPLPFLKTRLLYWLYSNKLIFSYKNMPKYKQCSAGTTVWGYLCETRISLTSSLFIPCLSSSWVTRWLIQLYECKIQRETTREDRMTKCKRQRENTR